MDNKANVKWGDVLNLFYPIGKLWISTNPTNPAELVGGTWNPISSDTFIASVGLKTAGQTGGNNNAPIVQHTHPALTHNSGVIHIMRYDETQYKSSGAFTEGAAETQIDASSGIGYKTLRGFKNTLSLGNHTISNPSGSVSATNANMPKYLACYIWQRIA